MKTFSLFLSLFLLISAAELHAQAEMEPEQTGEPELSLITDTPEEGFQVAIQLARKGVTSTQPDRDVLFKLREIYAKDPDALIASSQVIAIHFQTVAAANHYWRDAAQPESSQ
jgi:hypothetical protein